MIVSPEEKMKEHSKLQELYRPKHFKNHTKE